MPWNLLRLVVGLLLAGAVAIALPASPPAQAAPGTTVTGAVTTATARPAQPTAPAVEPLQSALEREAPRLSPRVLGLALHAAHAARDEKVAKPDLLTVIDYSLPSSEPRMWIFDLGRRELLYEELVAHGKNTGADRATSFSNRDGSKQSSLGLFRTGSTYHGGNGYSLRLHGLEPGVNDQALARYIVMHGAPYVSRDFVRQHGRLGRSWGCPAVESAKARPIIDLIKGGSLVFSYYPEQTWLASSSYLRDADSTLLAGATTVAAP